MEADHKTVKRLLDSMIARGMLSAPVTVAVPVTKSRFALCRPRNVLVYVGPDAKVLPPCLQHHEKSESYEVHKKNRFFGDYAILALTFGLAPSGGIHAEKNLLAALLSVFAPVLIHLRLLHSELSTCLHEPRRSIRRGVSCVNRMNNAATGTSSIQSFNTC
jgi:hypothetical protein